MPSKLREMKKLFAQEARKYNVFPLDNTVVQRVIAPRPNPTFGRTVFNYSDMLTGVPHGSAPSILNRSFRITADIEVPKNGAQGMLVTQGGRFGGFGFYIVRGKPVFLYNLLDQGRFRWEGSQALSSGRHTLVFDFEYNGPGVGKGGTGGLSVDAQTVASREIPHTVPFIFQFDETFDVGIDTGTPVEDRDYQVPFAFTGKLANLKIEVGPMQLSPEEKKQMTGKAHRNNEASE